MMQRFPNLVAMFFTRAAERGDRPFLWRKTGDRWVAISWAEAARRVAALAAGLERLGLRPGDRVMLVSENRPEWCLSDLAIMAAGCVTVPTYITNTERDHAHIVENSQAAAAIVSTQKLARALLPALARADGCDLLIGIEPMRAPQGLRFAAWDSLVEGPVDVAARAARSTFARADPACIIYTSGTGGAPRGVCQHHGAILANVEGAYRVVEEDFGIGDEVFLSLLPLSHAYEHSAGQYLPIGMGGQIYYAEGLEKFAANIEEVRPTIMVVVPRLFEVLRQRILKAAEKESGLARWLIGQAVATGGGPVPLARRPLDLLLSATVRRKVRRRFGGRLKAMVSGGAPLNPEVGQFFSALGITLLQGYGQTEAGPIISCNRPRAGLKMDTVGPPLDGVEVRIAADGEILVRGELVMHGYWRNPAETARVLKEPEAEPGAGAWLHTGDVGHLDAGGRIVITDRKKDLIVNDKGDNVAPQRVEGMLTLEPEIAQAMVTGDRRPHLVGLIVPDAEWSAEWAAAHGVADDPATLAADPAFLRALTAAVDRVNLGLSVIERVRRVIVADEPFSIADGELTPSLKIRRHVIRARYGDRLDALYRK